MAGTSGDALRQTMETIIIELENEGCIDQYFRLALQLKEVNGPYFFANLVLTFISNTHSTLMEMTRLLDAIPINFEDVDQLAIKLKGSSSCIGAVGISRACVNLRCAAEAKSHIGCIQAKNGIQYEFGRIHARLDVLAQLERRIVSG